MTKELNKTIMTRLILRKERLKEKIANSKIAYDKERNFCVNILCRTKKNHFANVRLSSIPDNKKFWKTVRPIFLDKIYHKETVENGTVLGEKLLLTHSIIT